MAWTPFNFFRYDPEKDDFSKTAFNVKQALNNNWDHAQQLITELRSKTSTNDFSDEYKQKVENLPTNTTEALNTIETKISGKTNKPTRMETTMTAAGWDKTAKTYSFESAYPHAEYDIEIAYSKICTAEQLDAWSAAMLAGDVGSNVVTALGDVPTVDIPIIVEVVRA